VTLIEHRVVNQIAIVVKFEIHWESVKRHTHQESCLGRVGLSIAIEADRIRVIVIVSLFLRVSLTVIKADGLIDNRIRAHEAVGREDLHAVDGVSSRASRQRGLRHCLYRIQRDLHVDVLLLEPRRQRIVVARGSIRHSVGAGRMVGNAVRDDRDRISRRVLGH